MEINFVDNFEILGKKTDYYTGKLKIPIGTSLLNVLNHYDDIGSVLEKYINTYKDDNSKYINEGDTLVNLISKIYKDLLKLDVSTFFVDLIVNILYEKKDLTYKEFAFSLIEISADLAHCDLIFELNFKSNQRDKELLYVEIPSCTIFERYIDKEDNITLKLGDISEKYHKAYSIVYNLQSIQHYFSAYFKYFFDNKIYIKKCENCGKYFIPLNRTDEKYCNNASPQNPKKTCKEYGAKKVYRDKLKSDLIKKSHYNTSQYYRMKINRCKKTSEKEKLIKEFEKYKINYEKNKKKYEKGKITENEFSNWIIEQKNIKKEGENNEHKRKSKK